MSNTPDNIRNMWEQAAAANESYPAPIPSDKFVHKGNTQSAIRGFYQNVENKPSVTIDTHSTPQAPQAPNSGLPQSLNPTQAYIAKHGKGGTGHDLETSDPEAFKRNRDQIAAREEAAKKAALNKSSWDKFAAERDQRVRSGTYES
jgi:hypothetical protein